MTLEDEIKLMFIVTLYIYKYLDVLPGYMHPIQG